MKPSPNLTTKSILNMQKAAISPPPSRKRRRSSTGVDATHLPASKLANTTESKTSQSSSLRIFSWNINGIAPFLQKSITSFMTSQSTAGKNASNASSLRAILERMRWPQILNLQEVKINPTDEATKRAVEKAVNQSATHPDDGPEYTVRFCLPRDNFNARGFGRKVYGVATILRKDFMMQDVETVREVDWDLEGRVLVVETRSKLSIFNIYAVNGTENPYKDPNTGAITGTRHDRKLAFHNLLLRDSLRLEKDGWRVILTGDMNISCAPIDGFPALRVNPEQHVKNRADYNKKFLALDNADGLRAVDSFRHLHPTTRKYTWISTSRPWLSSCDRVDHILVSKSLTDTSEHDSQNAAPEAQSLGLTIAPRVSLVEADVLMTEVDRASSDHVPIYASLKIAS